MGFRADAVVGVCSKCGEDDLSQFTPSRREKKGGPCRACMVAYNAASRAEKRGGPARKRAVGIAGHCPRCRTNDPSRFTPSALKRPGQYCKQCLAAYRKDRSVTGARRGRKYQDRHRAKRQDWLRQKKAERGCERCGERDVACLDFHHTDESTKLLNIGNRLYAVSKDRLEAEIAKTIVLCSNCHRKLHYYANTGVYARRKNPIHR